jgi:hypothetical protein
MPFCRVADPFQPPPSWAHTPQPDDPPPGEPGGPDAPPIGDPPPQPGEVPRSAAKRPAPTIRSGRAALMRWARWIGWGAHAS